MRKIIGILMLSFVFLSVVGATVLAVGWVGALIIWAIALTLASLVTFGVKFLIEGD